MATVSLLVSQHICKKFITQYRRSKLKLLTNALSTIMQTESKRSRTDLETVPVIGTHSGTFHCDEVLACFMLRQLPEYENAKIFRSRNHKDLEETCDVIVDVGGKFDPQRKWYDHHQKTFEETLSKLRPELGDEFKIKLSSAGLIYAHYGERIINNIIERNLNISLSPKNLRLSFVQIYRNFIIEIDAIDNGVPMIEGGGEPLYKISTNISARISRLNPSWEDGSSVTSADVDKLFEQAMATAGQEFVANVLDIGGSWIKAREYVREALQNAKTVYETGEILLLQRFCPWRAHLADLEKEYGVEGVPKSVIYPDGTDWRVAGVPVTPSSFLGRKFLPVSWHGLRDEELFQAAGISDLIFVHHTGFIGGAKTKEAAFAMAIKSVEWSNSS